MGILFTVFLVLVFLAIGINVFAFFYEKLYKKKLSSLAKMDIQESKE